MTGKNDGTFGYRVDRQRDGQGEPWIAITDYKGGHAEVHVPEKIDGLSVKVLAKKAFLSRKNLKKVFLPESLEEVGDWAFAYCTGLESVYLPKKNIKLGSGVFMECPKIKTIYAYGGEREERMLPGGQGNREGERKKQSDQTAALLAAAVALDAEYLLDMEEAGTEQWIRKWDARMKAIMEMEDGDGYARMILCGEEDYGCSLEEFIKNKRKNKVRLAMLRLLNPVGLAEENEALWKKYLLEHTKGCRSEETWEVIWKEHGYEEEYFQLFADIGGIKEENFDGMLIDMGENYAEMKAFFIGYKERQMGGKDFFDALTLDDW